MTTPIRGVLQAGTPRPHDLATSATRLIRRLAPQRGRVGAVLALGVAGTAIAVCVPRILGHATDLVFSGALRHRGRGLHAADFAAVGRTLALAAVLYLVAALLIWAQSRLLNATVQHTLRTLRFDIEDKLHRLPLAYFDGRQRGEVLSRVTNDIDNLQTSLSMSISQLLTSVLTVTAALVMMGTISPLLLASTVAAVPPSVLATRAIARRSQRLFAAQWAHTGRLNAHIEEIYSGFTVVRTFGHRAQAQEQFRHLNNELYDASFAAQFVSGLLSPATTFMANLGYVAVAVAGGIQVATGQITVGSMQAFIQYVRQFNQPLTQLAGMYNTLQSGVASAERVFELLDEPEESADHRAQAALPSANDSAATPPGRVEFAKVSFGYRPGTPVIRNVSLVAEPGRTVALVGRTGAGKTTLVNLLMRFYDLDSGRILIDGVDICAISRQSLRSRIGMVLQDTWLFAGTIAENIAYGRPTASSEEVLDAAKAAYVDRFVQTLPAGYQTQVSNDGGSLSAGERQLITIARAFLARPQVLILDEATSSVDTRTEALVQRATTELRKDRTSFIVAHRLSTIRDADHIAVLDGGEIIEQGSHGELLARRGAYYAMTRP